MGAHYANLAPALQRFHRLRGQHTLHGEVEIVPPASPPARMLAWLLGTPRQAIRGPVRFELQADASRETWIRHFPLKTMQSTLLLIDGQVVEQLGPARLVFALTEFDGALDMALQAMRFFGIPCPRWLMPRLVARETGDANRLHFDVQAAVPLIGMVTHYRGHLVVPEETSP